MASEISGGCNLSATKGGATVSGSGSFSADMAGTEMNGTVQTFTTSEAAVQIGGCDQLEYLYVKNMDATNNLILGFANPIVTILSTIKPGKAILVSGVSTTLFGKSSASTVDGNVVAVET